MGSRNKRSRSRSRRSSHSRKEGEIDRKVPARRPGLIERGSHGRRRRISSFKEESQSRKLRLLQMCEGGRRSESEKG